MPTSQYPRGRRIDGKRLGIAGGAEKVRALRHVGVRVQSPKPTNVTVCPSGPTVQTAVEMEVTDVAPSPDVDTSAAKCRIGGAGRDIGDHRSRRGGPANREALCAAVVGRVVRIGGDVCRQGAGADVHEVHGGAGERADARRSTDVTEVVPSELVPTDAVKLPW